MKKNIKSIAFLALLAATGYQANAQTTAQKIGGNPTTKDVSALLELEANNKGVLMPRVALTSLTDITTIVNAANSLTVFNTATTTTGTNDVTPGYYYWNKDTVTPANSKWVRLLDEIAPYAEPFNVESTTTKATTNTQNIYQNGNLGLGDFSATNPIARLDVRGAVRGGKPNLTAAIGANSAAFGFDNIASGLRAIAGGWTTTASGVNSTAFGSGTIASGDNAFVTGTNSKVTGAYSTAMGQISEANGLSSTAIGTSARANGDYSMTLGYNAIAGSSYETVLGAGNAITTTGNPTNFVLTDPLLQVGNSVASSKNNALTILKNAHTAIGVSGTEAAAKPTELLDLGGDATTGNGGLRIRNINSAAYAGDITTDKVVVADANGVLKTTTPSALAIEPLQIQGTTTKATANTDAVYQMGNVAIGTQNGIGTFHIDAAKTNPATGTPTATDVLDDIIVTPGGRVGFGYNPSDAVFGANQFDDKVTFQANGDLDVNYSLATSNNAQAIVHRNIISSGTIASRTARPNGTSIAAFEGHTSTSNNTFGASNTITQQRAGVVLRTGKYTNVGGEIWLGTSGANADGSARTAAGNAYRAIMDERGNWSFGADPNGDAFYRNPTQRLDLILGGVRIGALGYGPLASWRSAEAAERPNYISTDANDRVVVADANGVLKTVSGSMNNIIKITADYTALANDYTILANGTNGGFTLTLPAANASKGRIIVIRKTDETSNVLTFSQSIKISETTSFTTLNVHSTIRIQSDGTDWYKID
ncbi:hypothetical protein [Pedobacter sp. N23S346]|uniref:hypothetical protein n=1 Tax=Pedobacter sp. N23S346 TaxID=3402750 RepID=UPI003AD1F744